MDPGQLYMLQQFGEKKVVCLDGTHGLNGYDFELVTLLVIDDYGSGFPCCFMFTNLKDTKVYTVMFSAIKTMAGIISPNTFMTDIVDTFYAAWVRIMGPVPHNILCSWHVDKAWRQNLKKIKGLQSTEKQNKVYKSLKVLQSITDEIEFKQVLDELVYQLLNDADTKEFGDYFNIYYVNKVKQWAYCYRKNLGVNCNMHLESMHKTIKYHYLNGCKVQRLDKCIMVLRRFTRDKKVERMVKLTKGKSTSRINEIKKRHNRSVSLNLNINFDNNKWNVESENNKHTFYSITKCLDDICCPLICSECKICIHSYQCTCPDYQIKSIICKHIHVIAMDTTSTNTSIVELTPETDYQTSNIGKEMEVHIKSIQRSESSQNTSILHARFKDKAINLSNLIQGVNNPEHLKVAMQKLDALTAFINVASNENEVIPYKTDQKEPANKKITQQKSFFSTKNKRFKATNTITRPTSDEIRDLNDTLLHKKCVVLKEQDNEHSYF